MRFEDSFVRKSLEKVITIKIEAHSPAFPPKVKSFFSLLFLAQQKFGIS